MHRRSGYVRLQLPDLSRPKQAAKHLVRCSDGLTLASAHEALARGLGYRDWHELSTLPGPSTEVGARSDDALRIVGAIADAAGAADADVQYAVSRARLLAPAPWTLDDQLALRAALWRHRLFGPPRRDKPGTIVRDKSYGSNALGYLLQAGRPTSVLFDAGRAERADFEVATPTTPPEDFIPSRLWLPYGFWTLRDGSDVLFSRDYLPLWRIVGGVVERLDPWLWIEGKTDETHFPAPGKAVWASGSAREAALERLALNRIAELPRLIDVMAHLIEPDVESIGAATWRLRQTRGLTRTPPAFARINDRLEHA